MKQKEHLIMYWEVTVYGTMITHSEEGGSC